MTQSPMDEKFGNINQNLAENFDQTSKELFFELVIIREKTNYSYHNRGILTVGLVRLD
jgi:hypothetical protein